ncbi:hypothetical protein [uncultured Muribaculum sp.]|uniref:hypothetical protein n=1 Tax=uncultured Muribaculum sp. TaxID=1918613 RepID=UPI00264A356C|nr:hypothetical protein [uncultured Muribaculum sp.]
MLCLRFSALNELLKKGYRIFDIIKAELPRHKDFNRFIAAVERQGVECTLINNGSTNKVQGICFKMGKYALRLEDRQVVQRLQAGIRH